MKDKQLPALAIALAGTAILAAGAYGWLVYDEVESLKAAASEPVQEITQGIKKTPPADIQEIRRLSRILTSLTTPNVHGKEGPVDLALFGYHIFDRKGDIAEGTEKSEAETLMQHKATFAFVSGTRRFCVIDGKFHAQGDELPSGMRIDKIEANRIRTISKDGQTVWLELQQGTEIEQGEDKKQEDAASTEARRGKV